MKKIIFLCCFIIYSLSGEIDAQSQNATWIHPHNVTIDGNKVIKESHLGKKWNASTSSLQYLEQDDLGEITFTVPEFISQMFHIGFSNGCIDPGVSSTICGVTLQQRGPVENNQMALDIFIGSDQQDPKTNPLSPGDKVTLSLDHNVFTVETSTGLNVSFTILNTDDLIVAKASFKTKGHIDNVKLLGAWQTTEICNTTSNPPWREIVFPDLRPRELPFDIPIPVPDICKYVIDCPGCGINTLCLGDILRVPQYQEIESLEIYHKKELIQKVRPANSQKYISIPITTDISKKMAKNYSIKINKRRK